MTPHLRWPPHPLLRMYSPASICWLLQPSPSPPSNLVPSQPLLASQPSPSPPSTVHLAVKLLFEEATKVLQNKLQLSMGRKRSVDYVEPIEGESDKSQAVMKTSKPLGPIASADILKAKKKDLILKDIYAIKNKAVIADAMSSIDISIPSLTCDWFSREEFEKFVDDLILRKIEVQEVVVEVSKKKHRGPTKLCSVHGLDNGKRIVVQINELGQPVGEGGHSLKLFLGTIARLGDKMSIDAPTWRAMSATHKDDVWEYVQRKYDIPAYLKELVMKDLDQKWRSWKYELRNKYFNPTLKQNEHQIPPDPRVNVEKWKRVVQTWSSNSWKRYSDINKKSKSHHKYFHCAGTKSFADINEEESKQVESTPNMERCVQSSASVIEPKGKEVVCYVCGCM
ncbi:hypothetical protein Taro_030279 [Colocasia esculenta]|uniref:Uncharacterized protein n=1 Tax=Colocasia esculenta TaxID=4460 RepID=A0A843W2V9_COLES|nr:hypothetical protein [Colocasia esculenta]